MLLDSYSQETKRKKTINLFSLSYQDVASFAYVKLNLSAHLFLDNSYMVIKEFSLLLAINVYH